MKANHAFLWMVALLLLGSLAMPPVASAQDPAIQFVSPAGSPRYTAASDPTGDPISIDVEVAFPLEGSGCSPAPPAVIPGTLEVTVQALLDASVQDEVTIDTSSGWTWTGTDSVAGQVSVGGFGWSLYGIKVCIENGAGSGCATKLVRVEHPVSEFVGRPLYFGRVTQFSQSPANCVIPSIAMSAINNAIKVAPPVYITAPPAADYPAEDVVFQELPLLGTVAFPGSLDTDENNVAMGSVTITGMDLGPLNIPGYNCLIGGSADGALYGEVSPNFDLDGLMRVFDISVGTGSGTGGCGLSTPGASCNIFLTVDGNPTL